MTEIFGLGGIRERERKEGACNAATYAKECRERRKTQSLTKQTFPCPSAQAKASAWNSWTRLREREAAERVGKHTDDASQRCERGGTS